MVIAAHVFRALIKHCLKQPACAFIVAALYQFKCQRMPQEIIPWGKIKHFLKFLYPAHFKKRYAHFSVFKLVKAFMCKCKTRVHIYLKLQSLKKVTLTGQNNFRQK